MFGISLFKLLVLVLIVGAVWFGFKYLGRAAEIKADRERGNPPTPSRGTGAAGSSGGGVEDLTRCPTCRAYVPASQRGCGRPGCPYPPGQQF